MKQQEIEKQIHKVKFPNEEFDPNDFNDWAKENTDEAYFILLQIAKTLQSDIQKHIENEQIVTNK